MKSGSSAAQLGSFSFVVRNNKTTQENASRASSSARLDLPSAASCAIPGQTCNEGVVIALPSKVIGNGNNCSTSQEDVAESFSQSEDFSEPELAKVELFISQDGFSLSYYSDDSTEKVSICCSDRGVLPTGENDEDTSTFAIQIDSEALSHLSSFCALTKQNPSIALENHDNKKQTNFSPSNDLTITKGARALLEATLPITTLFNSDFVRSARIDNGISSSTILQLLKLVQASVTQPHRNNVVCLRQYLSFCCLLELHIARVQRSPPILTTKIIDRYHEGVRFVVCSTNKALLSVTVVTSDGTECVNSDTETFQTLTYHLSESKEVVLSVDGLKKDHNYVLLLVCQCRTSHSKAETKLYFKTKSFAEPDLYPKWKELDEDAQKAEILAVLKDRTVKACASDAAVPIDNVVFTGGEVNLSSTFVLWWSDSDRTKIREQFCRRELEAAAKDPSIRATAENEGVSVQAEDWKSTHAASWRRWKRFCWWYFDITPQQKIDQTNANASRTHRSDTSCVLPLPSPKHHEKAPRIKLPSKLFKEKGEHKLEDPTKDCGETSPICSLTVRNQRHGNKMHDQGDGCRDVPLQDAVTPHENLDDQEANGDKSGALLPIDPEVDEEIRAPTQNRGSPSPSPSSNVKKSGNNAMTVDKIIEEPSPDLTTSPASPKRKEENSKVASPTDDSPPEISTASRPRPSARRTTFLKNRAAKVNSAVEKVENMIVYSKNTKKLKGVALLKAKVRLIMITSCLNSLRERSGFSDEEASAQDIANVDVFDDFDLETFDPDAQPQKIKTPIKKSSDRSAASVAQNKICEKNSASTDEGKTTDRDHQSNKKCSLVRNLGRQEVTAVTAPGISTTENRPEMEESLESERSAAETEMTTMQEESLSDFELKQQKSEHFAQIGKIFGNMDASVSMGKAFDAGKRSEDKALSKEKFATGCPELKPDCENECDNLKSNVEDDISEASSDELAIDGPSSIDSTGGSEELDQFQIGSTNSIKSSDTVVSQQKEDTSDNISSVQELASEQSASSSENKTEVSPLLEDDQCFSSNRMISENRPEKNCLFGNELESTLEEKLFSPFDDEGRLNQMLELLPKLAYRSGCGSGASINQYEYETDEYKAFLEERASPPNQRTKLYGV